MAGQEPTVERPFFQPRPEHDRPNGAYLLWKIAGNVAIVPSGCWEWQGRRNMGGYGCFEMGGKKVRVHRVVYGLCVGEAPDGILVCHHCDNPSCCRPDHLFLGTEGDNNRDCVAKGRHPELKLSDEEALDVRRRAAEGKRGVLPALAREKGVSLRTIVGIVHGESRHHLGANEWRSEERRAELDALRADAPVRLRLFRQSRGLTQEQAGILLGFSKGYVSRVEAGKRVACDALVIALTRAEGA